MIRRVFAPSCVVCLAVAVSSLSGLAQTSAPRHWSDLHVWKVPIDGSPSRGPENAKVTIIEYADYTCPFTVKVEPTFRRVVNSYPDTVRLVIKHHWLVNHKNARLAAQVAVAAGLQGKFWEVHQMMLDRHFAAGPAGATVDGYMPFLKMIPGLDLDKLRQDVNAPAVKDRIDRDLKVFKSTATPEFIINGHMAEGVLTEAQFRQMIDDAAKAHDAAGDR